MDNHGNEVIEIRRTFTPDILRKLASVTLVNCCDSSAWIVMSEKAFGYRYVNGNL